MISSATLNFLTAASLGTTDTGERLKALAAYLLKRKPDAPPLPTYTRPPAGRSMSPSPPPTCARDTTASSRNSSGRVTPSCQPPKEEIPLDTAVDVINAALSKAEIAVHLLGEKAGEAPEDQLPMVKLQLALAAAKETQGGGAKFHRVIWAPSLWTVQTDADPAGTRNHAASSRGIGKI